MERYYKLLDQREAEAAEAAATPTSTAKTPSLPKSNTNTNADDSSSNTTNKRESSLSEDEMMAAKLHASLNARNLRALNFSPKLLASNKAKAKVKRAAKAQKTKADGVEKPKRKRSNGLAKPMRLSTPLIALLGKETLPRTQVVKEIWNYIREHNLQNPKDKRQIICDERMFPIFGKKVTMFQLNKMLSKHLFTDDEIVAGSYSIEDDNNKTKNEPITAPVPQAVTNGSQPNRESLATFSQHETYEKLSDEDEVSDIDEVLGISEVSEEEWRDKPKEKKKRKKRSATNERQCSIDGLYF